MPETLGRAPYKHGRNAHTLVHVCLLLACVRRSGRVFVCFPRWFANGTQPSLQESPISVAELVEGKVIAYPNAEMNSWRAGEPASSGFVNVQSVFVDHLDRLWILEPGAAYLGNITPGAPRLYHVDLATNKVIRTYTFDLTAAPSHSYLNDVRISTDGRTAFLTDSNVGGLRVLDLDSGTVRNVLMEHPSAHAVAGVVIDVEGHDQYLADALVPPGVPKPFPVTFQSDGIAVLNGHVYYHAVTARTLWRLPETALVDARLSAADLEAQVEKVCDSGFHDGMVAAADAHLNGTLLLTALNKDGIDMVLQDGRVVPLLSDERLQWPDSMAVPVLDAGSKPHLYVTASRESREYTTVHSRGPGA